MDCQLEVEEKARTGIPTLKVGFNKKHATTSAFPEQKQTKFQIITSASKL